MKKLLFVFLILCTSCKDCPDSEIFNDGEDCINADLWGEISACYTIYDPVCGCNKVTYSNDCYAKQAGVVYWANGKCLN